MSSVNIEFLAYWNERFPLLPAVTEFSPVKELWEARGKPGKFREWYQGEGLKNYALDFCLEGFTLGAEFDGRGPFSHAGAGANRDRDKNNQMLKLGYLMLRFPVSTVVGSPQFVADEILDVLKVHYEPLQ